MKCPEWIVVTPGVGLRVYCMRCRGSIVVSPLPLPAVGDVTKLAVKLHGKCPVPERGTQP